MSDRCARTETCAGRIHLRSDSDSPLLSPEIRSHRAARRVVLDDDPTDTAPPARGRWTASGSGPAAAASPSHSFEDRPRAESTVRRPRFPRRPSRPRPVSIPSAPIRRRQPAAVDQQRRSLREPQEVVDGGLGTVPQRCRQPVPASQRRPTRSLPAAAAPVPATRTARKPAQTPAASAPPARNWLTLAVFEKGNSHAHPFLEPDCRFPIGLAILSAVWDTILASLFLEQQVAAAAA